jgi:hypothetical protein
MTFALRYGQRLIPLSSGDFTIGRSTDSDLPLEDLLASRRHAVLHVAGDRVLLEDLGSRNGTTHNGRSVEGRVELVDGDRFAVGDQEFELAQIPDRAARETLAFERPTVDRIVIPPEEQSDTGLSRPDSRLLAEARASLDAGDSAEASAIAALLCRRIGKLGARGGYVEPDVIDGTTRLLVDIGLGANDWSWIDKAFDINRQHGRVISGAIIDVLLSLVERMAPRSRSFRPYYEALRDKSEHLSVGQLVRIRRLEVLGRALDARADDA